MDKCATNVYALDMLTGVHEDEYEIWSLEKETTRKQTAFISYEQSHSG